jgi:hypothetical protein
MDRVFGDRRRPVPSRRHQAPPREHAEGRLHRALGEPGSFGDLPEAESHAPLSHAGAPIPEEQVDDERRRLPVVPDEVGHQGPDNVAVDGEAGHGAGGARCEPTANCELRAANQKRPEDGCSRFAILSFAVRVVLFTPDGWEDRIGGFTNITFVADDVQRTYDELSAKGVQFAMPPKTEPWGTAAIFKDADGNQFVLSSRTK